MTRKKIKNFFKEKKNSELYKYKQFLNYSINFTFF